MPAALYIMLGDADVLTPYRASICTVALPARFTCTSITLLPGAQIAPASIFSLLPLHLAWPPPLTSPQEAQMYPLTPLLPSQLLTQLVARRKQIISLVDSISTHIVQAKEVIGTDTIHRVLGICFWTLSRHLLVRIE